MMNAKGINTDGIEVDQEGKTFFWSGKYHNDMNSRDTLITELNVLETFTPVVPESFKDAGIVMLGKFTPINTSICFRSNDRKTKISSFRYYEFLDGYCFR